MSSDDTLPAVDIEPSHRRTVVFVCLRRAKGAPDQLELSVQSRLNGTIVVNLGSVGGRSGEDSDGTATNSAGGVGGGLITEDGAGFGIVPAIAVFVLAFVARGRVAYSNHEKKCPTQRPCELAATENEQGRGGSPHSGCFLSPSPPSDWQ